MRDAAMLGISLAEAGWVPDFAVRAAIRRLAQGRLDEFAGFDAEASLQRADSFRRQMWSGPIAIHVESANEQHYEVAPEFFERVLGSRLKYSCALFGHGVDSLDLAELRTVVLVR